MQFFITGFMALGALLSIPVLVGLLATWRGFILSILWAWFLVPLGVPLVSVPLAIGFALIVTFLTFNNAKKDPSNTIISGVTTPLIFLLIGWIVKLFV